MRATARRDGGTLKHTVQVREHQLTVDEPLDSGGEDLGPDPRELLAVSLASCTAITMEMYADRKGWDLGDLEVEAEMEFGRSSAPESFVVTLRLPEELSEEQRERLRVIAGKCPVHRALSGESEISIEDRVELV
jgi:putative redox protein